MVYRMVHTALESGKYFLVEGHMTSGLTTIQPLEGPRSATGQVVRQLREAIISGRIAPGTRLPEAGVAARLGVSRIPVREALARLESEGLVRRIPYRGTIVVELTPEQLAESFMLRSVLEGLATKLATPRLSAKDVSRLNDLLAQLEAGVREGWHQELAPLHWELHSTIYRRCGSERLTSWINELYNQVPKNPNLVSRSQQAIDEYKRIIRAIQSGDGELAGRLMSEHLDNGSRAITKRFEEILAQEEVSTA